MFLDLDPRPEDGESYKFIFVRTSLSNAFFSELVHFFFLIFCMKLGCIKVQELLSQIFWENSRLNKFGQKWPKYGLFLLFLKIESLDFSDIVYYVRGL